MTRTLRQKLQAGGAAFGPMIFEFFSPGMPVLVANSGADFAFFDMEHTGLGFETLKSLVAGSRGLGFAPLTRVPRSDYHLIARALDVGAHGVMVPMIESREEAEHIARSAHYPPHGRRGAAFGAAHDAYTAGEPVEKMRIARDRTLMIAQIETERGLENVEAIAAVPDIDVVWVGHFDLTNFLGIPGEFSHPTYLSALRRVVDAARKHGKTAGFMISDLSWAQQYWELGFRMISFGPDHALVRAAFESNIAALSRLT